MTLFSNMEEERKMYFLEKSHYDDSRNRRLIELGLQTLPDINPNPYINRIVGGLKDIKKTMPDTASITKSINDLTALFTSKQI